MNIRKHAFKSIVTGIFLGGVPSILLAKSSGIPELMDFMRALNPPNIVIEFLVLLYLAYLSLSAAVLLWKRLVGPAPQWLVFAHSFFGDAGFALQSVLLAIAGALFVSLPPVVWVQPEPVSIAALVFGYGLAVGAILTSCLMAASREYVEARI